MQKRRCLCPATPPLPVRLRCVPTCLPESVRVAAQPLGWVPASFDPKAKAISPEEVEKYVSQLNVERRTWAKRVQERAPFFGVDPGLAVSLVRAESNFDPNALSSANAQGLMQLIPETAERFGVNNPLDPAQNIEGGLAYLRWLLKRFDHDVIKTTAAYNAGEGAVDRYEGVPPYPETRAYVERILRFYRAAVHTAPPVPKSQRVKLVNKAPAQTAGLSPRATLCTASAGPRQDNPTHEDRPADSGAIGRYNRQALLLLKFPICCVKIDSKSLFSYRMA